MKIKITLCCILLLAAACLSTFKDFKVFKAGDSVIDAKALTIKGSYGQAINGKAFQQDGMVSHKGYQYVAYYDAARHVCLARRKLPDGSWNILRLMDYDFESNDAHNTISMGICPQDGTIHMAFDHHGHPLHYRVSRKGMATDPEAMTWKASLFGSTSSELEKGQSIRITYPRFWQTPEGGLQFCYRRGGSGNGDRMLVDYDAGTASWINTRQIDSGQGLFEDAMGKSETRCSYPNGYDYGPQGRLHATWVWRESSQGSNHDLMYAYSEDQGKTWLNNNGESLTGPLHVNSPGITVVTIDRAYGLMNTHGQAVDSQGRIHAVMWHCSDESLEAAGSKSGELRWGPPEAHRYNHYWRDVEGTWQHGEFPWMAGNRPKLFIDENDNAYLIYCAQHDSIGVDQDIGFSAGDLIIAAATADSRWTDWQVIHAERGPFVNEMLGDLYRWKEEGILSVIVQELPKEDHDPTPLRILDFSFKTD